MPIQTIVASLVLIHLRDEIDTIRATLAALRAKSDKIEPRFDKFSGIRNMVRENQINIHELLMNSALDDKDAIETMWDDLRHRILSAEIDLAQVTDTYNNVLTLVRMDNDPEYQPSPVEYEPIRCTTW